MLKSFYDTGNLKKLEGQIEYELRCLIMVMPLDETIILSPSFRYESSVCMSILEKNREFVDDGYIAKYMQETSEYDFKEKKSLRYKSAMEIEKDYYEAYGKRKTYQKVNDMPMRRIPKIQQVGKNSREIFKQSIRMKGKKLKINERTLEEIIKIVDGVAEDTFLWEVVEYNLRKANIDARIINALQIREEMNLSYLQVFKGQDIILPYNSNVIGLNIGSTSEYDLSKTCRIMSFLGMELLINSLSAKDILKVRYLVEFQEIMEIIRNGLKNKKSIKDICEDVRNKGDLVHLVKVGLESNEKRKKKMSEIERTNTLKLLHLSDLHLADKESMKKFFKLLNIDLRMQLKVEKIDYLVISGDVCNRPLKAQYEVAVEFCRLLIEKFQIDIKKTIVVPGNHDCDRDISREAYGRKKKEFDTEKMKQRFKTYNDFFYRPLLGRDYSMEYGKQIDICDDQENRIYIIGLNSAYMIDHRNTEKSGICMETILEDENVLNKKGYLKIAVWHHPVSGYSAIEDKDFLQTLAIEGYQVCFHGHIHEATNERYKYDDGHNINIVGAGTFGAVKEDRGAGIPLQYNYVEIDIQNEKMKVHTRKRENENGAWMADARWGDKGSEPKAFYFISYSTEEENG